MKAARDKTCARWPGLCDFLGEKGNEGSNKFWEKNARFVILVLGLACLLLFAASLLSGGFDKGLKAQIAYYISILVAAFVGASMAAWRARQFQKSLEQTKQRDRATKFADYLALASSESEATAQAGFALLKEIMHDLDEEQLKAVYQAIICAMSFKKRPYSVIRKDFREKMEKEGMEDAIQCLEGHLDEESSPRFRQYVLSFWRDYTDHLLTRGREGESVKTPYHITQPLFTEGTTSPSGLNFANLNLYGERLVRVERGEVQPEDFYDCVFFKGELGIEDVPEKPNYWGRPGILSFHHSLLVDVRMFQKKRLDKREPRHTAQHFFDNCSVCNSSIGLFSFKEIVFINTEITGAKFHERYEYLLEGVGYRNLQGWYGAYWIFPVSNNSIDIESQRPKFILGQEHKENAERNEGRVSEIRSFINRSRKMHHPRGSNE